ncbi:hypothetical protein FACS189426_05470 [Bacteroidia bacterium]|nr:hypothetical protein FACS189426_05470 [Bacteroidia bacterium]
MNEIPDIHQVIEELFSQLAAMREELELLTKENEQLRERLLRYEHPKDSHNSHLPSSKNPIGKIYTRKWGDFANIAPQKKS